MKQVITWPRLGIAIGLILLLSFFELGFRTMDARKKEAVNLSRGAFASEKAMHRTEDTLLVLINGTMEKDSVPANAGSKKEEQTFHYCIRRGAENTVLVFDLWEDRFLFDTGLRVEGMPSELKEQLREGIFLPDEEALYNFLESYSS